MLRDVFIQDQLRPGEHIVESAPTNPKVVTHRLFRPGATDGLVRKIVEIEPRAGTFAEITDKPDDVVCVEVLRGSGFVVTSYFEDALVLDPQEIQEHDQFGIGPNTPYHFRTHDEELVLRIEHLE